MGMLWSCAVCGEVVKDEREAERHLHSHPLSSYYKPVPVMEWPEKERNVR